jgi:hypothetical protein
MLLSATSFAECEDPPAAIPLNPALLEEIIGTPQYVYMLDCCCYSNWLSNIIEIPAGSNADQCCDDPAPGYVTRYTIRKRMVLPVVTEGSRNVDDDSDGEWDYHMESIQWETAECTLNGVVVRPCWPGWRAMTETYIFECGDC